MKKSTFFIFFIFLGISINAKILTSYSIARGIGDTRSEAIKNALIEVVKQTNGVSIASARSYSKSIRQTGISVNSNSSNSFAVSEHSRQKIVEATRGFIRSYSIIDSYKEGGNWHVKVRVKHLRYKVPGFSHRSRRKMVVFPLEFKSTYDILNSYENGKEVSTRVTQELVSKLTQSRKFAILDRENSNYYKSEKSFILSGDSSKEELLKLCKRLGADYLFIGKLLDLKISKEQAGQNDLGIPMDTDGGYGCVATISYRILAMATQQIKWSETISYNFAIPEKDNLKSAEAILAYASDKIADKILYHILSNIYPPMIISVTSNSIIVNQGGNSIHKGDIFKAYKKGERLKDPYTGEYLGYEELEAGEIVISRVTPKISYAHLLRGSVSKGMILRKVPKSPLTRNESEGEATTDVKISPNGGVVLPFDN